ncbi:NAD(P)-binding protein [Pseudovirgaria hyperparasitica]|uniref:NAD(P)-binding protein n=1 Tax=Pseudovirgaria hyperparasitica TaxID=470096 RepID=A0A6A6W6X2_9PEZI|nr:NAD(P)-binding protein [Pseudovirgaria hyperparasitica]KAF2758373.1 NAD(P)-binding protein [Pseudovirgaria hyperparasitica]
MNTIPAPQPPENEHLIQVQAAAITNGELGWAPFTNWPEEHIPIYDMTGTILTNVPGSKFKVGDQVYGHTDAYGEGAACQLAHINHSAIALKPKSLTWTEAAAVPTSSLTAYQGLFTHGGMSEPHVTDILAKPNMGKRVLITAASGGVGVFAVQFAKLTGATVVGTCGPANKDFVFSLGTDEVIDYHKYSITKWVNGEESKKFDVILNCAADHTGETLCDAVAGLKENGALISIVPGFKEPESLPSGAKAMFFILSSLGHQLESIAKLFDDGRLHVHIDSAWQLDQYQEAFDRAHSGRARGRVVVKI